MTQSQPHNDEDRILNFTKPMIAAVAVTAALVLTACGSDDGGSATDTTAAAATTTEAPVVPTVEDLNTKLLAVLDPAVPVEETSTYVQGFEGDPNLLEELAAAVAQAETDGLVSNIEVVGPLTPVTAEVMTVPFTMEINGEPAESTVDVVLDDGEWKLSKGSVCELAGLLDITSPECPDV